MTHDPSASRAVAAARLSALLLTALCAMTLATRASQQLFERAMEPGVYARLLLAQSMPLRAIIAVDDLFVLSYVAATALLCRALGGMRRDPLLAFVLAGTVAAGLLDWSENHHIVSMLHSAEAGLVPRLTELHARETLSALKWLLGHGAFALLGLTLVPRTFQQKALCNALLYVQLPVGVLALVATHPTLSLVATWLRYANLITGFASVPWLLAAAPPRGDVSAVGSGAPA